MLKEDTKALMRAILIGDRRPWRTIDISVDGTAAELHLALSQASDAAKLAATARDLGFTARTRETQALNESLAAEAHRFIEFIVQYGPSVYAAYKAFKDALDVPDTIRKLREKIRPHLAQAAEVSAPLQLPLVVSWLDRNYGPKNWKVLPSRVEVKTVMTVTLFVVPEEITGKIHLLAVEGDEIEELPSSWMPATEAAKP